MQQKFLSFEETTSHFKLPSSENEYKHYMKRIKEIPRIYKNDDDANIIWRGFANRLKHRKIFDREGFPYFLDFNILRTFDYHFKKFNSVELKDLFLYRMLLTQLYDDTNDDDIENELRNQKYLKRLFRRFPEEKKMETEIPSYCNNRIDFLWTYVNGSEENWINNYQKYSQKKLEKARYRDYGSLKYSMRSVFENVPFDIHWHLVVQDEYQIPSFLDKSKLIYYNDESKPNTLRIIYHKDFFPDKSVLPVFNSNAIESAFFNIEGIGECFVYMNDDFFINSKVSNVHFFDKMGKPRNYGSIDVIKRTFFRNNWAFMLKNSNDLLSKRYGQYFLNRYPSHVAYVFRKSHLNDLYESFKANFDYTMKQKIRTMNDTVLCFMYLHFTANEYFYSIYYPHLSELKYFEITTSYRNNYAVMTKISEKDVPFICINDGIQGGDEKEVNKIVDDFSHYMENYMYPTKTIFEI